MALREQLDLDIADALRRIGSIETRLGQAGSSFEAALSRAIARASDLTITPDVDGASITSAISAAVEDADDSLEITADAADVTGSISAAVEDADSEVTVTADATDVSGSITAAVDDADSEVLITADATDVTGSITAAVENANTTVTVSADTAEFERDVSGRLSGTGAGAGVAAGSAFAGSFGKRVGGAIAALGVGLILKNAISAASSLEEAGSKVGVVFGDAAETIEDFASTSAFSIGLARREALGFLGTFGNLFVTMGVTRDEAAEMSTSIVQLGADLASFNDIEVDDALTKLRSGLVGEVEPLRQLGVAFAAADVEAKALELGLVAVGEEASQAAKLQARYALILEQTGTAQGDFARTSEGLANSQRTLQGVLGDLSTELGQQLLPAVTDTTRGLIDLAPRLSEIIEASGPGLGDLLADLAELGLDILPVVLDTVLALEPALGATTTVISALATALGPVIGLIDAIPDPLLAAGGAALVANKGIGALSNGLALLAGRGVGGAGTAAAALTRLHPALLAVTAVTVAATSIWSAFRREQQENKDAAQELSDALFEQGEAFDDLIQAKVKDRLVSQGQEDDLRRAGVSLEEYTEAVLRGGPALTELVRKLDEAGEANAGLLISTLNLGDNLQDQAKRVLDLAVVTGQWTEAQIAANTVLNSDGTPNYARTLDKLNTLLPQVAAGERDVAGAHGEAGAAVDAETRSVEELIEAREALAEALLASFDGELALQRAHFGVEDAAIRTREAEKALTDALNAHGSQSAETEEATRDLERAHLDETEAALRMAEATSSLANDQAKLTGGSIEGAEAAAIQADALRVLAGEMEPGSPVREALEGLIHRLDDYATGKYEAVAELNTELAEARLAEFRALVESRDIVQRVKFSVDPNPFTSTPFGPGDVTVRQHGGPVSALTPYLVGETGPELFVPGRDGTIVSNAAVLSAIESLAPRQVVDNFSPASSVGIGIDYDRLGASVAAALSAPQPVEVTSNLVLDGQTLGKATSVALLERRRGG